MRNYFVKIECVGRSPRGLKKHISMKLSNLVHKNLLCNERGHNTHYGGSIDCMDPLFKKPAAQRARNCRNNPSEFWIL